jgi:hypothetical protein
VAAKITFDITRSAEFRRVRDKVDGLSGDDVVNTRTSIRIRQSRPRKGKRSAPGGGGSETIGTEQFQVHQMGTANTDIWDHLMSHP